MGLFSNKKKTKTYTQSVSLMDVDSADDISSVAIVNEVLKPRDRADAPVNLCTAVTSAHLNGHNVTMRKVYNYGRDHYTLGLPGEFQYTVDTKQAEVRTVIEGIEGEPISIVDHSVGAYDEDFFPVPWLQDNRGFDFQTKEVTEPPFYPAGNKVYYIGAYHLGDGEYEIYYSYDVDSDNSGPDSTNSYVETVQIEAVPTNVRYYYTAYTVDSDPRQILRYFYYSADVEDTYPTLAFEEAAQTGNPYFPVVPIFADGHYYGDDTETEFYKTAERLCDIAGMDYADMCEQVKEDPSLNSQDADIFNVTVQFALPIHSHEESTWLYLAKYFERMEQYHGSRSGSVHIKDDKFHSAIEWSSIDVTDRADTIGSLWKTSRTYLGDDCIRFEYQLSKGLVRTVSITDLRWTDWGKKNKTNTENIDDNRDPSTSNFLVPLSLEALDDIPAKHRHRVSQESYRLVVQTYYTYKEYWYQQNWFKWVITIAVTVFTAGSGTWAAIGAMSATAATMTLVTILVEQMVSMLILKLATMIVADIFGDELAILFAIVAGSYMGAKNLTAWGTPTTASSFMTAEQLATMPSLADSLLGNVPRAVDNSVGLYLRKQQEELITEAQDLAKENKVKMDALHEQQKELDELSTWINPLNFAQHEAYWNPSESSQQFLTRTTHAGNIGVLATQDPHVYISQALTLPEIPKQTRRII